MPPRRIILLTDGFLPTIAAKTAHSLIRYRPTEVVAVLDTCCAGRNCQEVLGFGGAIPIVAQLSQVADADTLLVGIAPPGGNLPTPWKPLILDAIARKMRIVSGLHDFLRDDPELVAAARRHGVELVDVRANDELDVATFEGLRAECLRIHTVGNDCSCGKMTAALEITAGLRRRGVNAKFVATGQTGIMIEGDGLPIDRVISDFVSGAAEKLVLRNQHHDALVVEGQGSLFHPRYSCVTLGLLHGVRPDAMVLCYEMGRRAVSGMPWWPLAPLPEVLAYYERTAALMHPARVVGVAVSSPGQTDADVNAECRAVEDQLGLPTVDVYRHGAERLVESCLELAREQGKSCAA